MERDKHCGCPLLWQASKFSFDLFVFNKNIFIFATENC
jgi:hypothetical protein